MKSSIIERAEHWGVVSARRLRTLQSVTTVPSVRVFLCLPSYLSPTGSKARRFAYDLRVSANWLDLLPIRITYQL